MEISRILFRLSKLCIKYREVQFEEVSDKHLRSQVELQYSLSL